MRPRPPRTEPFETDHEQPYRLHLLVCTDGPECPLDGPAKAIRDTLKAAVKQRGLKDAVRINKSGCLGQCGHGPMLVVYPEGIWYSHLDEAAALAVFERHVVERGPPLEAHRFTLGPGGCKAARDESGRSTCQGACHGVPAGPPAGPTA